MWQSNKLVCSSFVPRSSFASILVLLLVIIPLIVIVGFLSFYSPIFTIQNPFELLKAATSAPTPTPTPLISSSQHNDASKAPSPFSYKETSEAPAPFTLPPPLVRIIITHFLFYLLLLLVKMGRSTQALTIVPHTIP